MLNRSSFAAVLLGVTTLAVGCGEEDDYKNEPRPATPIVVSAAITEKSVSVSPKTFGAGPITLIVTNQTQSAQELVLETEEIGGSAPGIEQETGPINPGDTASLKANLREGTYRVGVNGKGSAEATIDVSEPRESAQNELLQP
ncbi:MAG TPA: hypothetical protein VF587_11760 [Solirubrobacteraceae bacterium]|jgi:hypothetical protein